MNRLRKWSKLALGIVVFVVVAQLCVSILARTRRVHNYLARHLEQSFGRTVEVRHFSVLLLPSPVLDAEQVTVGEDPAFGQEYFLRADRLTARLRWTGLLRGHFEFGTLSLIRPSLILTRNDEGSWNLERWLPPAKRNPGDAIVYGPQAAPTPANRLQKINIDEGRVNFKVGDEKLPFAFLGVSGSVEQVSAGRWRLRLEAQPWRSGVTLQSTGTLIAQGDVAGTSARLQPARVEVHWGRVSIADFFRLFTGQDYGLRGAFALDATAKSGELSSVPLRPGDWSFAMQARASEIHRWDLTERSDNPAVNVNLEGTWNVPQGMFAAQRLVVETRKSNVRGSASVSSSASPSWEIHVDTAGVQVADLLSWYRAFHTDVNNGISVDQFFTGEMTLRGWPLEVRDLAFSSNGGEARVPGLNSVLRVGALQGGLKNNRLTTDPVRVSYGPLIRPQSGPSPRSGAAPKRRSPEDTRSAVEFAVTHDFQKRAGSISVNGRLEKVEDAFSVAAAFGRPLNHGWNLTGPATAALHWDWEFGEPHGRWNGRVDVSDGVLQAVGLNLPLQMNKARLEWRDNVRSADIADMDGFGTSWSGQINQAGPPEADGSSKWNFQLHANHLDATTLDLWAGPRARPNWLQRLLPSLLGGAASNANPATALVRRINAEGELRVDEFDLEKISFTQVRAQGSLRDLHLEVRDADAQWAGGKVRAKLRASFLPQPTYDATAELDRVDLAQLPPSRSSSERFSGVASGILHLTTQGVGREDLLDSLTGRGDVRLHNVEFRGWDVSASVADGEPREGASRWTVGEAAFTIRDRGFVLGSLRLDMGAEKTLVKGTVSFSEDTDLTVQTSRDAQSESRAPERHVLKIHGPLDLPHVSIEKLVARQPAD